jgi:hypothetical protein
LVRGCQGGKFKFGLLGRHSSAKIRGLDPLIQSTDLDGSKLDSGTRLMNFRRHRAAADLFVGFIPFRYSQLLESYMTIIEGSIHPLFYSPAVHEVTTRNILPTFQHMTVSQDSNYVSIPLFRHASPPNNQIPFRPSRPQKDTPTFTYYYAHYLNSIVPSNPHSPSYDVVPPYSAALPPTKNSPVQH